VGEWNDPHSFKNFRFYFNWAFFGYTAEEAMGNDLHAMAAPPEVQEQAKQGLIEFAKTGRGAVFGGTIQTPAINRAGDSFPAEISLSSFHVDNQWFAVGTIRDITERKKSEDELKDHMEDMKRFNHLAISREERMIELKEEINRLLKQQGKEIKYKIR
jgi:PAS domain S-box-containing protein